MGIKKYIETPELLLKYFDSYLEAIKLNPIKVKDYVGKDGDMVIREKERPLTMEGFENHCEELGIICDFASYFSNKQNRYAEFATVCSRIKRRIRQDQIEGGMAGIYNPSITQRLNGLVEKSSADDKKDITIKVKYGSREGNTIEHTSPKPIEDTE